MRAQNVSVPEVVREIIGRTRPIYDCLKMDLINYTSLAVKIQPEIERVLGNPVNLNTIVVAIKRYADSFKAKSPISDRSILKDARLVLTSGMIDVKIPAGTSTADPMLILSRFAGVTDNYEFFRLGGSFRLLAEDMEEIRDIVNDVTGMGDGFSEGLAKISILIPRSQNRTGVVSYVAEVLHVNGIELVNAYFGQDNIIIVVDGRSAAKAYDILSEDIRGGSIKVFL